MDIGHGTLKMSVSQKRIDVMKAFLHGGTNSGKLKAIAIIFGWHGQK